MDRPDPGASGGIRGPAVDAAPEVRPGVPRVRRPAPDPGAHWQRPEQQRGAALLSRAGLREATPVFGTAQPACGLSGLVRRAAYRVPEHRTGRWALLLAADRIDVLEHRLARGWWILPAAAALALGYAVVARAVSRR
ncbi:MAG TPA: hypothetical protein VFL83_20765 [Anaeromyxobacter sp.]|nr:hypothetical protein [Anaeromyxobacter sp.]